MTTIRDVAKRAGVAPITVSRVLNNPEAVRPATRQRVEEAIAALEYVPNHVARSLRSNRTNTLALVLTDITNPFWTTVARGVEDAASARRYNVILCNTDESEEKQTDYLTLLLRRRVDGFLLVPARSEPGPVQRIQQQNVPVVVLDRQVPGAQVDVVRADSVAGSAELIQHLLDLGHRQIAVLAGPRHVSSAAERVQGYQQALAANGLVFDEEWVRYGNFSVESGYAMASEFLQNGKQPTAFFAVNNFVALGALKALREKGIAVPGAVSVVSFDDLPASLLVEPFLTVAAQPAYEMGRRATELLLRQIAQPDAFPHEEVVLPTELIVRASSQAPAQG